MAYDPNTIQSLKITKTYLDYQTASTTNTLTLFTPSGTQIVTRVLMAFTQAFAGTSISAMTIEVDYNASALIGATNALVGAINSTSGISGSTTNPTTNINGTSIAINAKAISTGANLDQLTQGSIDFYIFVTNLPTA